jgi:putative SOS response-associated peptidase YedK
MCGRFTLTIDPGEIIGAFPGISVPSQFQPRYNIAPSQPVAVITNAEPLNLTYHTWGLIPAWAKDPAIGNRMINARAETLSEKPAFRNAIRRRRCLILADGFYEWQSVGDKKRKMPHYFFFIDHRLFCFAGLWESWHAPDGSEIRSCTIITTEPNRIVAPIHNRMPVILSPENYRLWLSGNELASPILKSLFAPFSEEQMTSRSVSQTVNNPQVDSLECIKPA